MRAGLGKITFDRAFVAVTVLWALGLLVVVGGRLADSLEDDEESGRPPSVAAPPTTEPPTREEITAAIEVESGFAAGAVWACDTEDGPVVDWYPSTEDCVPEQRIPAGDIVSYGLVVENNSDQLVRRVRVDVQFLDATGTAMREPANTFADQEPTSTTFVLPELRPGERFGLAGLAHLQGPGTASMQAEVRHVEEWMPEGAAGDPLTGEPRPEWPSADLAIGDVALTSGPDNELVLSFPVDWEVDSPTSSYAYVVFRDSAGAIVGGAPDRWYSANWARGPSTGSTLWHQDVELALDAPLAIPGIDPARTEVFATEYFPEYR